MALEWIAGIAANVFSSAVWDALKSAVGRDTQGPVTLGLDGAVPIPLGPKGQEADLATLAFIGKLLPSEGIIAFLRTHNFGFAHRGEYLEPLDRFLETGTSPDRRFLSPSLERLRQELLAQTGEFQHLVEQNTFHSIQPDMFAVPDEWERQNPRRYFSAVSSINQAAEKLVQSYDTLVDTARRQLLS